MTLLQNAELQFSDKTILHHTSPHVLDILVMEKEEEHFLFFEELSHNLCNCGWISKSLWPLTTLEHQITTSSCHVVAMNYRYLQGPSRSSRWKNKCRCWRSCQLTKDGILAGTWRGSSSGCKKYSTTGQTFTALPWVTVNASCLRSLSFNFL